VSSGTVDPESDQPASSGPLGTPGLWQADAAHSVVSVVELRSADHGCEFALHTSTVELDSRAEHTHLDLRVELESVACAYCGTPLLERPAVDPVLRWSAAHCVMASAAHPNLLVAAGTVSLGSIGRSVELVGSATARNDLLFLQVTGTLPLGALVTDGGRDATTTTFGADSAASITLIAQLQRRI